MADTAPSPLWGRGIPSGAAVGWVITTSVGWMITTPVGYGATFLVTVVVVVVGAGLSLLAWRRDHPPL